MTLTYRCSFTAIVTFLLIAGFTISEDPIFGQSAPSSVPPAEDCGCDDALPELLATVNGIKITKRDLNPDTLKRIQQLHKEIVDARGRELDLQINSSLLDAEAKRRGVAVGKVLEVEVLARTVAPTEADAQAFYNQNKARINAEFNAARAEIVNYLTEQRQREMALKLADRLRAAAQVKVFNQTVTPPANEKDRARVFANVNGQNITSADVEDSLKPMILNAQEQVYTLRKRNIDLKINDVLLSQEAQKKKVTVNALLDEVNAKVPAITDADAQKFYNENKDRVSGNFAELKPQIVEYLKETAQRDALSTFAEQLRGAAQLQVFFSPPKAPIYTIPIDDQPSAGNPNATVTLVMFTDFQCPSCATQHLILDRLIKEYRDRVSFVVRDFPLPQHQHATKAAEAAEAAREQGKYWEYAALLYRNQSALQSDNLKQYAARLNLNMARFEAALLTGKASQQVQRDILDAQKFGINQVPSIFVNGRRVNKLSYDDLKATLETSLKK
jgi:protein-disulfide isomerase